MVPENIHNSMEEGRGVGVTKTQKFKAMYEAKFEFPEGWAGVIGQTPSMGGMGIFWNNVLQ